MDIIDSLRDNAERGRYCGSDYIAAADEIARLRALLELDESGVDGIQCRDATIRLQADEIRKLRAKLEAVQRTVEIYHEELAASQAREAKLRDAALEMWSRQSIFPPPADDSALRERLRMERERCAAIVQANADACYEGSFMRDALMSNAEAIRALSDE